MLHLTRLSLLLPLPALANEAAPGVGGGTYLQAVLALLVIVLLLVGLTWLARRVSGGKVFGNGTLKVIGGVALGPRERLVLVEAGDTWLVIGIVPGQIRTLHHMPKGETPENPGGQEASFAHWLKQLSEQRKNA